MSRVRIIKRVVVALFASVVVAIAAAPWGLYAVGLYGVVGRPEPLPYAASPSEQAAVWSRARGTGIPVIPVISPYTYMLEQDSAHRAGVLVAWWVARDYLYDHQCNRRMIWWHVSGAALTIWLTRNWTTEQILTKAAQARANAG